MSGCLDFSKSHISYCSSQFTTFWSYSHSRKTLPYRRMMSGGRLCFSIVLVSHDCALNTKLSKVRNRILSKCVYKNLTLPLNDSENTRLDDMLSDIYCIVLYQPVLYEATTCKKWENQANNSKPAVSASVGPSPQVISWSCVLDGRQWLCPQSHTEHPETTLKNKNAQSMEEILCYSEQLPIYCWVQLSVQVYYNVAIFLLYIIYSLF